MIVEEDLDYVLVYDLYGTQAVDNNNLPKLNRTKYTGTQSGVTQITHGVFHIVFKSDSTLTKRGFKITADVIRDTCGSEVTNHGTTISSPDYPNPYTFNGTCQWTVIAPDNYGIEIQFVKFELHYSVNCSLGDKLTISGENTNKEYCGLQLQPEKLQMNDSRITISFKSYNKTEVNIFKGFTFTVYFYSMARSLNNIGNASSSQCGKQVIQPWPTGSNSASSDRIVGGNEAVIGSWPWLVYIEGATCGGVILNNRYYRLHL